LRFASPLPVIRRPFGTIILSDTNKIHFLRPLNPLEVRKDVGRSAEKTQNFSEISANHTEISANLIEISKNITVILSFLRPSVPLLSNTPEKPSIRQINNNFNKFYILFVRICARKCVSLRPDCES